MTLLATTEREAARITQALAGTNKDSAQVQELSQQLEIATKQVTDARAARGNRQKTLGDLKTAADKSAALVARDEAQVVKLKVSTEAAQKALQAVKESVAQLEAAKAAAAQAAKKETEALQVSIDQANSALAAAKAETSQLQAKLDSTEKFSDAFNEATQRLEIANKQVTALRVPADHDRKEAADLETALARITNVSGCGECRSGQSYSDAGQKRPELSEIPGTGETTGDSKPEGYRC